MPTTIREYIERDLTRRIADEPGLSADLTLKALSEHYRVSLTPVREALRALVDQGVLLKDQDGRVRINPKRPRRKGETTPPEPPHRAADLEAALTAEIIARSLRGEADYLREEATAHRFGAGARRSGRSSAGWPVAA